MTKKPEKPRQATTDKVARAKDSVGTPPKPDLTYRPVPHSDTADGDGSRPVWRLRFETLADRTVGFGLDVNGEVILGRGKAPDNLVDLSPYDGEKKGVSRRHAALQPTATNLFMLDLGSTNGTSLNGRPVGVGTPRNIGKGEMVWIGEVELVVQIVQRPRGQTDALRETADLAAVLAQMAKDITAQRDLDELLGRALDTATSLTSADEAAIWLVDETTDELFLEAEQGIKDEKVKRMRLPVRDTMVGKVIKTGKTQRASRKKGGKPVKIKTGYMVEAVIYVPLTLGSTTFGVLMAAHRQAGAVFKVRDERLLTSLADFVAIAVQNARLIDDLERALSELSKAQDRLVQTARLAALGELAAIVAHQINNPLTIVMGDSEMLLSDLPADHPNRASAAAINAAGQRAGKVVGRLLNMARPEGLKTSLDVNDTIRPTLALVRSQFRAENISLEVHLAPGLPAINVIQDQLEDVWLNLLLNARDALRGKKEGRVAVRSAVAEGGQSIEVTVEDSGSGIPPNHEDKLFDPFFTTKPHGAGTGLGLYICKQIVDQHEGQIAVLNVPDKGTRVSVHLPVEAKVTPDEKSGRKSGQTADGPATLRMQVDGKADKPEKGGGPSKEP
jgi:signal transduction histidine kinase